MFKHQKNCYLQTLKTDLFEDYSEVMIDDSKKYDGNVRSLELKSRRPIIKGK